MSEKSFRMDTHVEDLWFRGIGQVQNKHANDYHQSNNWPNYGLQMTCCVGLLVVEICEKRGCDAMANDLFNFEVVKELYRLTKECSRPGTGDEQLSDWTTEIQAANIVDLVALTSRLSCGEKSESRNLKALREAVISEIERQNAHNIIETMEKLDGAATKLIRTSIALAAIGVAFTIIQVILALVSGAL